MELGFVAQRCHKERKDRLKNLTAHIQKSMAKATPVRTTKLAYVESVARAPRGSARSHVSYPPPPFIFLLQNVFHDGRFFVGRPATQGENGTSAVLASITKAKGTSRPFEASNAAGHGSAPALVAEVVKVPATAAARMSGGSSGQYRHGEASTSGSSAACNTPVSSSFSPYSLFLRQRSSLAKKEPVSQWMGRHPHLVT